MKTSTKTCRVSGCRFLLAALALNSLLFLAIPAQAANLTWTNGSGTFGVAGNWNPNQAPVGGDAVSFTNPSNYTVTFGADALGMLTGYFNASSGTVTLDITGYTWGLTNNANGTSSSAYGAFVVGQALNSTATVYLAGGTLAVTNAPATANLLIGGQGVGSFYVTNGTVFANQTKIGSTATGKGTLVLSGSGTRYTNSSTFYVGYASGSNSLVVSNGATLFTSVTPLTIGNGTSNNTATVYAGGTWNLGGQTLSVGSGAGAGNVLKVSGGMVTNAKFSVGAGSGQGNSIVITNGGLFVASGTLGVGPNLAATSNFVIIAGANGSTPSLLNANGGTYILGQGANSTGNWTRVDNGGVLSNVSGSAGLAVGYAGTSVGNYLIVTNGGKVFISGVGLQVGYGAGATSNFTLLIDNGLVNLGNMALTLSPNAGTGNWVRIENAILTNGNSISVGAVPNAVGNSLVISRGGKAFIPTMTVGNASGGVGNSVLITNGGLLEVGSSLYTCSGNTVSNVGGVFQFTSAAPILSNSFGNVTLTGGTISYRNFDAADVKGSLGGNPLTNILFAGANTFRLDNASNSIFVAQDYTFGGSSPSNYVALEMINGSTAWRNGSLTIGAGNGTMLVSNTSASILGVVTNLGTITVANATATYSNNVVLNGGSFLTYGGTNFFNGGFSLGSSGGLAFTTGTSRVVGVISNSGTINAINANVTFAGPVVISGRYFSDPSTNIFTSNVTVTASGSLYGSNGDLFVFQRDFINQSTNRDQFNLVNATVLFTNSGAGAAAHTLSLSNSYAFDRGSNILNIATMFTNFGIGTLSVASNNTLTLTGVKAGGTTNALYVGWLDVQDLELRGINTNNMLALTNGLVAALNLPDINLYYDKFVTQNAYLGGLTYDLWGGQGLLIPIPEPSPFLAVAAGLGLLGFLRRRGA